MESIMELQVTHSPEQIVTGLPKGEYKTHFQPNFTDELALLEAIRELQNTTPVTNPENIDLLNSMFAHRTSDNQNIVPVVITGNCAEPVEITTPILDLARKTIQHQAVILQSRLSSNTVWIERGRGQNTKPRSNESETLPDGRVVTSFMGDAVNSKDPNRRKPDPSRMVAAAVQARDIEQIITHRTGVHLPAAHEALLVAYEKSFIRHSENSKKYLLSCDLPWLGWRTNDPNGLHVEMLSGIENPIGIKLGDNTDEELVRGLVEMLNPEHVPGKLLLMIRINKEKQSALERTCSAIAEHAPNSQVLYDLHGSTTTLEDGTKVRVVDNIIDEIQIVAKTCGKFGLRLDGVHLETTSEQGRIECVDQADERPMHPGNVDPQLNSDQTRRVLNACALLWR